MGKRARAAFRAADKKAAASKRRPTNAASRRQLDNDVDARMDAVTAEHKRSQPRITRVDREGSAGRRSRQRAEDEEEAGDEVDAFMQQRDRIALNPDEDDREDEMNDEDDRTARVLDLPDDEEEAEQDEGDEEAEEEDGEELGDDELYAETPEDAFRPLPVDDILGENDEQRRQRSLREEERLTTAWGRNKRLYYSADTAEFELESDDEVAKEEEQEADRLMKRQLAQRRESDYTLAELMSLNAATSVGADSAISGARRGKGKQVKSDVVSLFDELGKEDGAQQVEQVERMDAMSEREKLKAITARAPELVGLMEEMKERVEEVEAERRKPLNADMSDEERERRAKCMEALELALMMYMSAGVMYLALRAEGRPLDSHPISQQLVTVRAQLTRLLAVKDAFTSRALKHIKHSQQRTETVETKEGEEDVQQNGEEEKDARGGVEEVGVEEMDGEAESDELEHDEEEEEDEQKEERKSVAPTRKVDIFSSLKPAMRATKSSTHILTAPRPSAHNLFAGLEDDADTPARPMSKRQKVKATIVATAMAAGEWKSSADNFDDDEDDLFGRVSNGVVNGAVDEDEDEAMELYDQLQAQQHNKKRLLKQQKQARSHPAAALSRPSTASHTLLPADHRPISTLMDRNEGLKPSRPKDRKTPKTRNRARYEKAMVKRRSQVREYQGQGGVYGGEATGIRRNVAKSVRLKG